MSRDRLRPVVAIVAVVVLVVAGVGLYVAGTAGPSSPKVLNEKTEQREVRPLHSGLEPGFPSPSHEVEGHEEEN
jgi:hypothetical protein